MGAAAGSGPSYTPAKRARWYGIADAAQDAVISCSCTATNKSLNYVYGHFKEVYGDVQAKSEQGFSFFITVYKTWIM